MIAVLAPVAPTVLPWEQRPDGGCCAQTDEWRVIVWQLTTGRFAYVITRLWPNGCEDRLGPFTCDDAETAKRHAERRVGNGIPRPVITDKLRAAVYRKDRGICSLCHLPVSPLLYDVDHRVPWSLGGRTLLPNLFACHPACNRSKGARIG